MKLSIEYESEHTHISFTTTQLPSLPKFGPEALHALLVGFEHGQAIGEMLRKQSQPAAKTAPVAEAENQPGGPEATPSEPGYPRWFVHQKPDDYGARHWLALEEEDGTIVHSLSVERAHPFSTLERAQQFIDHWWHKDLSKERFAVAPWFIHVQQAPNRALVPVVRHDGSVIEWDAAQS